MVTDAKGDTSGIGAGVTYATTASASWITLDPTGSFAYVPTPTGVHAFRVDAYARALTELPSLSTASQPMSAVADPNGPFIYTSGGGVEVLAINDGGALTELNPDAGAFSTGLREHVSEWHDRAARSSVERHLD